MIYTIQKKEVQSFRFFKHGGELLIEDFFLSRVVFL